MKKITLMLGLLALIAVGAMAEGEPSVNLSGELDYGLMYDVDGNFAGKFNKIELDVKAAVDEYNSFSMEIEDKAKTNDIGDVSFIINWATVTTDWGTLFELPVGVTTSIGYDGPGFGDAAYVTGIGLEGSGGLWVAKAGSANLSITYEDLLTLSYSMGFDPGSMLDAVVGASVSVAPVSVYMEYATEGVQNDGEFIVEAKFSQDVAEGINVGAAGHFDYNLKDAAPVGEQYNYGFGVAASGYGAMLGVSMNGMDETALNALAVDLNYMATEDVSLDVGTELSLVEGGDLFQGLEFSAAYTVGAASYRLGYTVTEYGFSYKSIASLTNGGVFFNVALNY